MERIEPRAALQLAKASFRRQENEDQLRARCLGAGADPDEAVAHFRQLHATMRPIPAQEEFLEDRFVKDHSEAEKYGGQGFVVFGYERLANTDRGHHVAFKAIPLPPGLPSGKMPIEIEVVVKIDRSRSKYLRRNLIEYLATGYWDRSSQTNRLMTVVMPRADLTLREFLKENGPLNSEDACRLIIILSQVVHHLHTVPPQGVMHRDLKPENILLYQVDESEYLHPDGEGTTWQVGEVAFRPVVADLGLAKWVVDASGNVSLTERERGTINYMAREQFLGGHLTPAVDIYALGVLIVECLTGKFPFDIQKQLDEVTQKEQQSVDFFTNMTRRSPPPLNALAGRAMDPRLNRIVRKCLMKGPAKRYCASGLAADLARFLDPDDQGVDAPVVSWRLNREDLKDGDVELWYERGGRILWRAVAVILLILLLVSGPSLYTWLSGQTQAEREIQQVSEEIQKVLDKESSWWTDTRVQEMLSHVTDFDRLDAGRAAATRKKLNDRFTAIVEERLRISRLQPADVTTLQNLINSYRACDDSVATDLMDLLNKRIYQWNEVWHIKTDDSSGGGLDPQSLKSLKKLRFGKPPTEVVKPSDKSRVPVFDEGAVLGEQPCDGNVRLEATFNRSWERTDRLALYLNARQGHTNRVCSASVSPNGRFLATAAGLQGQTGEVIVWDAKDGTQLASYEGPGPLGHRFVVFSPKSDLLAVATMENDSSVDLLETVTWKTVARLKQNGEARCMSFSPDGETLAVAVGPWDRPGQIKLWDLRTKQERKPLPGHKKPIQCLAFDPDGKTLASGGWDAKVRLLDVASGSEKATMTGHQKVVLALDFSPDGKILATSGPDGVRLWDAGTGREQSSQPYLFETFALAFSPDGNTLGFLSYDKLILLDCKNWQPRPSSGQSVNSIVLAFAPHDDILFTGGKDHVVRAWNYSSWTQRASLHDQGYTFMIRIESPLDKGSSAGTLRSFRDAPPTSQFFLQVFRNGVALRAPPARLEASKLIGGPLHLVARREGDQLTFEVNGLTSLVIQDTFPLSGADPGVSGLRLPPDVGLQALRLSRQDLPVSPTSFESGDDDFNRGDYKVALEKYRNISEHKTDPEDIRQSRYKEALCQLALGKHEAAEELLEGVSRDVGSRWSVPASGQLWLHYLETKQSIKADEIFQRLSDSPSELERLATSLPAEGRDHMLSLLRQQTWGINLFYFDPNMVEKLEKFDRILQQLEAPLPDRVLARIALLRAYWLVKNDEKASEVARGLLKESDLEPVNRIMVLEAYCWLLRQTGNPQEAMNTINDTLIDKSSLDRERFSPLLLERARLHLALKNVDAAKSDLEQLVKIIKERDLPYRYQSGAYLMLGFLHDERGERDIALNYWSLGFRSKDQHDFPSYVWSGDDFGSLGLLQGLILGSLTGKLSDSEAQGVIAQILATRRDAFAQVNKANRLMLSTFGPKLIPPEILQKMWTSDRARENARQLAFQNLPVTDYLRTILTTASASVLRHELVGELSMVQEDVLWNLAKATASAYSSGKINDKLMLQLGPAWLTGNVSGWEAALQALMNAGVEVTLCDRLHYFFGHRLLRRNRPTDAKNVFTTVRDRAGADASLKRLVEQELLRFK